MVRLISIYDYFNAELREKIVSYVTNLVDKYKISIYVDRENKVELNSYYSTDESWENVNDIFKPQNIINMEISTLKLDLKSWTFDANHFRILLHDNVIYVSREKSHHYEYFRCDTFEILIELIEFYATKNY